MPAQNGRAFGQEVEQQTSYRNLHVIITIVLQKYEYRVNSRQLQLIFFRRSPQRMRTMGPTGWLLLACICVPLNLSAQSQTSPYEVSVRELKIPPRAKRAFEQGLERLAKKDPEGSLTNFEQAIAEFAGYYEAYDRIGAADLKLWRIPEAEQAFRKSIELSVGQYAHPQIAL